MVQPLHIHFYSAGPVFPLFLFNFYYRIDKYFFLETPPGMCHLTYFRKRNISTTKSYVCLIQLTVVCVNFDKFFSLVCLIRK